jgi:hypothetical protein
MAPGGTLLLLTPKDPDMQHELPDTPSAQIRFASTKYHVEAKARKKITVVVPSFPEPKYHK